jgi:hypothetical protein
LPAGDYKLADALRDMEAAAAKKGKTISDAEKAVSGTGQAIHRLPGSTGFGGR